MPKPFEKEDGEDKAKEDAEAIGIEDPEAGIHRKDDTLAASKET